MLTDLQGPVPFWSHFKLLILCPSWKPKVPISVCTAAHHWQSLNLCAYLSVCRHNVKCRAYCEDPHYTD